jgi:hypothetical protein
MNDEVKAKVRETFNRSRIAVYHNEKNQDAFLRAAAGVIRVAQKALRNNRYQLDRPKLESGQRFDSHETNHSKFIVSNLTGSWLKIFAKYPSGRVNSVFYNVVNDLLSALGKEPLGQAALRTMLGKN